MKFFKHVTQFLKMKRISCSTRVTKTGIDTMNMIRKYPACPVNAVKNNLETLKWEKCIERSILW